MQTDWPHTLRKGRGKTMRFYDALQLDSAILKRKIDACDTKRKKETAENFV